MAGSTWRLNTSTGEVVKTPHEDPTIQLRAQIAELEAEVRRWKFNAAHWEGKARDIARNMTMHHAERASRLARVAKLVNVQRKTLKMEDLHEALYGDLSQ